MFSPSVVNVCAIPTTELALRKIGLNSQYAKIGLIRQEKEKPRLLFKNIIHSCVLMGTL